MALLMAPPLSVVATVMVVGPPACTLSGAAVASRSKDAARTVRLAAALFQCSVGLQLGPKTPIATEYEPVPDGAVQVVEYVAVALEAMFWPEYDCWSTTVPAALWTVISTTPLESAPPVLLTVAVRVEEPPGETEAGDAVADEVKAGSAVPTAVVAAVSFQEI